MTSFFCETAGVKYQSEFDDSLEIADADPRKVDDNVIQMSLLS